MPNKNQIRKIRRWIFFLSLSFFLFLASWYGIFRLLSSGNVTRLYEVATEVPLSSDPGSLIITTFNIAHGRGGEEDAANWQEQTKAELLSHLKSIARQIKESKADIVILNEVDFSSAWSFNINQAEVIAKQAGYPYIAEQRNMDVSLPFYTFQFGNAILSRTPLRNVRHIDFPPYSGMEDIFIGNHDGLYAITDTLSGPLGILALHLEYRSEKVRLRCAEKIIAWTKNSEIPIIAAGDFNASPTGFPGSKKTNSEKNTLSTLLQKGAFRHAQTITSAEKHFTFSSTQPRKSIDWILAKGKLKILNSHSPE